jgi:hypothetical protein
MAQLFPNVLPGDLITADQMNRIVQTLNGLNDRVTALEGSVIGGSAVVITDLVPPSGNVQVGNQLVVIGRNFGFSVGSQRVYIDDLRVDTFLPGSSDSQLIFIIPPSITNVPQQGRAATLTVSNSSSSATRTLMLQSALVLTGTIDVSSQGVTPATITQGVPATFAFLLSSRANLDATVAVSATVNVAANQPAWQANVQLLDSNQTPLASNQVLVRAGQTTLINVRIGPVPAGTNGQQFSLQVDVTAGGSVSGSSGPVTQTVGNPADQPDTTIKTLNFSSSHILPPGAGNVTATQITLNANASTRISLNADFTLVGNYVLTPTLISPATNWTVGLLNSTPSPFPIIAADLANAQGVASKTLDFNVQRLAGATNGQIEFKVQRQGAAQFRRYVMTLVAP